MSNDSRLGASGGAGAAVEEGHGIALRRQRAPAIIRDSIGPGRTFKPGPVRPERGAIR